MQDFDVPENPGGVVVLGEVLAREMQPDDTDRASREPVHELIKARRVIVVRIGEKQERCRVLALREQLDNRDEAGRAAIRSVSRRPAIRRQVHERRSTRRTRGRRR
jgi:hypothetical protein